MVHYLTHARTHAMRELGAIALSSNAAAFSHSKLLKRRRPVYLPALPSRPVAELKEKTFYLSDILQQAHPERRLAPLLEDPGNFLPLQRHSRNRIPKSIGKMAEKVRQLLPFENERGRAAQPRNSLTTEVVQQRNSDLSIKNSKLLYRNKVNPAAPAGGVALQRRKNQSQVVLVGAKYGTDAHGHRRYKATGPVPPTFLLDIQVDLPPHSSHSRRGFYSTRLPSSAGAIGRTPRQIEEDMKRLVLMSPNCYPFKTPPNSPMSNKRGRGNVRQRSSSARRRQEGAGQNQMRQIISLGGDVLSESHWQLEKQKLRDQYPMYNHRQRMTERYQQEKFTYQNKTPTSSPVPSTPPKQHLVTKLSLTEQNELPEVQQHAGCKPQQHSTSRGHVVKQRRPQVPRPRSASPRGGATLLRVSPTQTVSTDTAARYAGVPLVTVTPGAGAGDKQLYQSQLRSMAEKSLYERDAQHEMQLREAARGREQTFRLQGPPPSVTSKHGTPSLHDSDEDAEDEEEERQMVCPPSPSAPSIVVEVAEPDSGQEEEEEEEQTEREIDDSRSASSASGLLGIPSAFGI